MRKIFDIIVLFLIGAFPLFAQEQVEQKGDDEGSYPHRLSIMMANSHIPAADDVNGKKTVFSSNFTFFISLPFSRVNHANIRPCDLIYQRKALS